jgi:alginate O-acetyltransferase complex protein AlgI
MLFCTSQFFWFFLLVFAVYWAVPWARVRVALLLVASGYFYASWNPGLALLVFASATLDYLLARGIEATESPRRKRLLLIVSVTANLGVLVYLKYANFFLRSLETTAHTLGISASLPVLKVILPIGISFYTFEAISYVVDVYCGRLRAETSLGRFLLFILFFPHLVAGPIVRARDFLPQVDRPKRWNWERASIGLLFILLGYLKKKAIADRLALYSDPVFTNPGAFSSATLWLATIACAVQIYCDFSGYSDMALGLAHLLGYHLVRNFNLPFLAVNISDFWRRWHISLSSWLRDYLFLPLGGSRCGRWKTYRNLLFVMTIAGLWHGAGWNYVLFGVAHGLLLIGHRLFREWCEHRPRVQAVLDTTAGTVARIALTFTVFVLTLVIFRATTLSAMGTMFSRMLEPATGAALTLQAWGLYVTLLMVAIGHAVGATGRALRFWEWLPRPVRGVAFGGAAALAIVLAPPADRVFLYFQF